LEHNEAEELLVKRLTEEKTDNSPEEASEEAVKQLLPRWEIRIQAEWDPVIEETKAYRAIASEVDGRYDTKDIGKNSGNDAGKEEIDEGQSR
jgi:hypothetical protein